MLYLLKKNYCGKFLTNDEYNHAIEEFRVRAEQEYKEQRRKDIQYFEEQKRKLIEKNQEEMDNLTKYHNKHSNKILEELKTSYNEQMENLKKSYEEQEDFKESLSQRMAECEHELYQKDKRLQELENGLVNFRTRAMEEAKTSVRNEIEERDTQINRLKKKVDELGKQLSQTQSELKGEAAEVNLLRILQDEFQDKGDYFEKERRGSCGADIIQQIRTISGEVLETKIAYDNKESTTITKQDIERKRTRINSELTTLLSFQEIFQNVIVGTVFMEFPTLASTLSISILLLSANFRYSVNA